MKAFAALLCSSFIVAAPASASPDRTEWSAMAVNESVRSGYYDGTHETPTLRRQKTAWTLALRDEVYRLQRADGGTLSPQSIAYIRKEVTRIRTGR